MDLSVAIVSWNTREALDQCLKSVFDTIGNLEAEVVVVDNASTDGSVEMVHSRYPLVKLIQNPDNVGFPRANNQAFMISQGRHFLLLNPDTICFPNALPLLVDFLEQHPKVGVVGPLILNPDKTLQYSWARFPTLLSESLAKLDRKIASTGVLPTTADEVRAIGPFRTDWVGGCCLLIRREAVEQIGLMDEGFFMYSEETDWCYRLHASGWEIWVEPGAEIVHLGGQSSSQVSTTSSEHLLASKVRYFRKHHGWASATTLRLMLRVRRFVRKALRDPNDSGRSS
jgi:N-acetylglucosaminyl-diphospho-decaprenol L-rhamnosyltransferase